MPRNGASPIEDKAKSIISNKLKRLIKNKNITQASLSKQTGIPTTTLSGYSRGKRLPSPENIEKLAKYFGIEPEELDPRFNTSATQEEVHYPKKVDLKDLEDRNIALSYDGKDLSKDDLRIIEAVLKRNELLKDE